MGTLLSFGRGGQEPLPTGLPLFAQDYQGLIQRCRVGCRRREQHEKEGKRDKAVSIQYRLEQEIERYGAAVSRCTDPIAHHHGSVDEDHIQSRLKIHHTVLFRLKITLQRHYWEPAVVIKTAEPLTKSDELETSSNEAMQSSSE